MPLLSCFSLQALAVLFIYFFSSASAKSIKAYNTAVLYAYFQLLYKDKTDIALLLERLTLVLGR
jgi:hypothetical protein